MVTEYDEKIAVRVAVLERDCEDFKSVVSEIRNTLLAFNENLNQLVRLDEKHIRLEEKYQETSQTIIRIFQAIEKNEKRISDIETDMPGLREMRALIARGVSIILIAVLGAMMVAAGLHT